MFALWYPYRRRPHRHRKPRAATIQNLHIRAWLRRRLTYPNLSVILLHRFAIVDHAGPRLAAKLDLSGFALPLLCAVTNWLVPQCCSGHRVVKPRSVQKSCAARPLGGRPASACRPIGPGAAPTRGLETQASSRSTGRYATSGAVPLKIPPTIDPRNVAFEMREGSGFVPRGGGCVCAHGRHSSPPAAVFWRRLAREARRLAALPQVLTLCHTPLLFLERS